MEGDASHFLTFSLIELSAGYTSIRKSLFMGLVIRSADLLKQSRVMVKKWGMRFVNCSLACN